MSKTITAIIVICQWSQSQYHISAIVLVLDGMGRGWWVDVNLKGYLRTQQRYKLTETKNNNNHVVEV